MTNRFPLILDADSQKVKEIPAGDDLDLTGNSIISVRDIIPESTETYDLGSDTNRWNDLYLSGNSIIMDGGEISFTEQTGFVFTSNGDPVSVSIDGNTTDDLTEGTTNLYFTTARARDSVSASGDLSYNSSNGVFSVTTYKSTDFDTDFSGKDTDDLSEGIGNLYFTTARARDSVSASGDLSYNSSTGIFSVTTYKSTDFDTDFSGKDTDDLSEGTTNLYFTEARARNSISVSGDLTYNASTGVLGVVVPEGYDSTDFDTDFTGKDTDDLSEGTTNLYFTTARIDSHLSGGTGVTYNAGEISIGQTVSTSSDVQFNDLILAGNLTVQGTQTVLETATLQVEDQNIELGKVATPTNATANTGGITVLAGTDGNKTWKWLSATASWTSSEHIDLANGKEYKVNGTTVLTNNTLESGVVNSSLISVGALTSGSIAPGFGNIDIGSSVFTGDGSGLTNVYTSSNFNTDFTGKDTDDLSEGITNLYFTEARSRNSISVTGDLTYNASTGVLGVDVPEGYDSTDFDTDFSGKDTDDLSEGITNLYFTEARSRNSISVTGDLTYNASTGVLGVDVPNTNITITGGSTAGPTINSSTGTGATIATASATESGVVTTAAQTWAGVKTFNDTISANSTLSFTGTGRLGSNMLPDTNGSRNLGSSGSRFDVVYANVFNGTATTAKYADLAEKYISDESYPFGTVVMVNYKEGPGEVTACEPEFRAAGVVSENPAFKMNSELENGTYIALKGRVPVYVTGSVKKGDALIPYNNGVAIADQHSNSLVFAIALESNSSLENKLVECLIL